MGVKVGGGGTIMKSPYLSKPLYYWDRENAISDFAWLSSAWIKWARDLGRYCGMLQKPGFWGGEVEILVLSRMLQVPIYVYQNAEERGRYLTCPCIILSLKHDSLAIPSLAKHAPLMCCSANGLAASIFPAIEISWLVVHLDFDGAGVMCSVLSSYNAMRPGVLFACHFRASSASFIPATVLVNLGFALWKIETEFNMQSPSIVKQSRILSKIRHCDPLRLK